MNSKLQQLQELRDPSLKIARLFNERAMLDVVGKMDMIKGDKGEDGYSPVKGKDYYTPEEIQAVIDYIQSNVKDGEQGIAGPQGLTGKDGETPIRGVDFWTKEDQAKIISDTLKQVKVPAAKDGVSPKIEDIVSQATKEFAKLPFDTNRMLRDPQLRMLLRGGGLSLVSHDSTITGDGTTGNPLSVVGGATMVSGPASATDSTVALFDGITGKLLKDSSGITVSGGATDFGVQNVKFDTTTFFVDSVNHRVGQGTITPQTVTEIVSPSLTTSATVRGVLNLESSSAYSVANTGSALSFTGSANGSGTKRVFASVEGRKTNTTSSNQSGYLAFATNNNGTFGERMRIDNAGFVGINTQAAATQLEVSGADPRVRITTNGTGLFTSGLQLYRNVINQVQIYNDGSAVNVKFDSYGVGATGYGAYLFRNSLNTAGTLTNSLTIGGNGNVGVQTETLPTSNFQVGQLTTAVGTVATNGTTTLTGTNTTFTNTFKVGDTITVQGETVRTIATIVSNTSLTVTVAFSTTASGLTYTQVGGTRFSVFGNGNVGIGTTNPGQLLVVSKSQAADTKIKINNESTSSGAKATLSFGRDTGDLEFASLSLNRNNNLFSLVNTIATVGNIEINPGSGAVTYFTQGNVGIGTATPQTLVEVAGASETTGVTTRGKLNLESSSTLAVADAGSALTYTSIVDGGGTKRVMASIEGRKLNTTSGNQLGYLSFRVNAGGTLPEVARFTNTGYFGIGLTPTVQLNIGAGTPTTAAFGLQFGTDAVANLYRSAASTIKADGNVSIGGYTQESTDTLSGAGAVSVTKTTTKYTTAGVGDALTLANGVDGQVKRIILDVLTSAGHTAILTPTTKTGFTTVTFSAAGQSVSLQYVTTRGWIAIGSFGAVIA